MPFPLAGTGIPSYSPTTPATRGFRDSRVTRKLWRTGELLALARSRGARPPRPCSSAPSPMSLLPKHRPAGRGARRNTRGRVWSPRPSDPTTWPTRLLPNHTRQGAGSGIPCSGASVTVGAFSPLASGAHRAPLQSQILPIFQLVNLTRIGPFLGPRHQTGPNRIGPHVVPLLRVRFAAAHNVIEKTFLPMR